MWYSCMYACVHMLLFFFFLHIFLTAPMFCMHAWPLLSARALSLSLHIFWQLLCLQHALLYACIIPSHHFLPQYILTTHMCCSKFFFMHILMFEVYFFSIYVPVSFTDTVIYACPQAVSRWCRTSTGVLPLFLFFPFFLPSDNFFSAFHLVSNFLFS